MSDFRRKVRSSSRLVFLGALIYAPWAYGCTRARDIRVLNLILAAALGLWVVAQGASYWLLVIGKRGAEGGGQRSDVRRWRAPNNQELITNNPTATRWALIVPSVMLLLLGWWMALNARWIYDSDFFLFIPRGSLIGAGPGSVDFSISVAWMVRGTLLIGVTLFVAQLCRDPVWLLRIWWTIAIAGGSIAFLGLAQKATGAPMIFWESIVPPRETFFATYYAHGNAGAYLNLVLPACVALALRSFLRKGSPVFRAITVVLALLVVIATISNTSRGGQAVALLLLLALPICFRDLLFARVRRLETRTLVMASLVIGFAIIAVAGVSQLGRSLGRWQATIDWVENNTRLLASRAALRATGDAGWFGFGPGTFRVVFPYYTNGLGSGVGGVWRFLHQDYLQTLMEWGWIGSAAWTVLFFGGIWSGTKTVRRRRENNLGGRQRLFLTASVLALAGVALHALVDFPFQIASLQLYVATYVGVCAGSASWAQTPKVERLK